MKDVAGATSAAPTYFSPKEIVMNDGKAHYFVDGGMFLNNPQVVPLLEVIKLRPDIDRSEMLLVSIGTGSSELSIKGEDMIDAGILGWMRDAKLIELMMDGASDFSDFEGDILYPHRYRIQIDIPKKLSDMDVADNAPLLLAATEAWIQNNGDLLDKIAAELNSNDTIISHPHDNSTQLVDSNISYALEAVA